MTKKELEQRVIALEKYLACVNTEVWVLPQGASFSSTGILKKATYCHSCKSVNLDYHYHSVTLRECDLAHLGPK